MRPLNSNSRRVSPRAVSMDETDQPDFIIMEFLRSHLTQVVSIHRVMFEKLLFESKGVPLELSELLEDVGNTYLEFSERISKEHLRQHELSAGSAGGSRKVRD